MLLVVGCEDGVDFFEIFPCFFQMNFWRSVSVSKVRLFPKDALESEYFGVYLVSSSVMVLLRPSTNTRSFEKV